MRAERQERHPFRFLHRDAHLRVASILSVGVVLSFLVFGAVRRWEDSAIEAAFQREVQTIVLALQREIESEVLVLRSLGALYASSPHASRETFRDFLSPFLSRHRGIQAVEWIPRGPESERAVDERTARLRESSRFQTEESKAPARRDRVGQGAGHFPLYLLQPEDESKIDIGVDLISDPGLSSALERSRDTGEVVTSAPIMLTQDGAVQPGFLVFIPIYREKLKADALEDWGKNLKGFVVGGFRVDGMLESALAPMKPEDLDLWLYDMSAPAGQRLLYPSPSSRPRAALAPIGEDADLPKLPYHTVDLRVPGRQWRAVAAPSQRYIRVRRTWKPWTGLLFGLLVTTFLATYFVIMVDRTQRVQELVEKRTADLQRAKELLEREVANREATEKELTEHRAHLRDLVERSTAELRAANRELEQEIAERRRAEQALEKERDMAQKYLDVAGVMFVAIDADGKVTRINRRGCEILRYGEHEIVGHNWFDIFIPEKARDQARAVFVRLMAGEIESVEYCESPVLTKDGEERAIAWHNAVLTDEAGTILGAISSGEDVTERKRLEAQLLWSQKMETVGRLAGGVAHDFNNLLMAIQGHAELALMQMHAGEAAYEDLQEVIKESKRAAGLVRQLLAFSRRQVLSPKVISLNDILLDMDKMLRRLIGEDIELVTLPADDLKPVSVDPGQIELVIVNLVVNARDAMPQGGKLTLETANLTVDTKRARRHTRVSPGDYVVLTISDTGVGMTPEVKAHIFEPFFTTKEQGKGTGLGLATCYGIVKQSGGFISASSEPGQGTRFEIYFPVVKEEIESRSLRDDSGYLPRGKETVLLVEDEPSVRRVAARVLRDQGYNVYEASNGHEALAVAEELDGEGIHLLLTDVVMPQMSGKALVDRMRTERADLKVLFMSGYANDMIGPHGILDSGTAFLQKPFSPGILARKVREVLDS